MRKKRGQKPLKMLCLFTRKLGDAALADVFLLEGAKSVGAAAEVTDGNVFLEDNLVLLNVDLHGVGVGYAQLSAKLLGYYHASKLVNVSNNAC